MLSFLADGLEARGLVFGKGHIPEQKSVPVSAQYFLANGLNVWDLILGKMAHSHISKQKHFPISVQSFLVDVLEVLYLITLQLAFPRSDVFRF